MKPALLPEKGNTCCESPCSQSTPFLGLSGSELLGFCEKHQEDIYVDRVCFFAIHLKTMMQVTQVKHMKYCFKAPPTKLLKSHISAK